MEESSFGDLTTRRAFLRIAMRCALVLAIPARARAAEPRRLRMLHTHTGEYVDVTYFDGRSHLPDALAELNRFLRDFRTDEVHPIDPAVLDLASSLAVAAGQPHGTFEIVSGFRSTRTNTMLRERSSGVALHSMHLEGKALDLRLRGVATIGLRDLAASLARGGVGYYAANDFIHIDTGRVRRW